MATDTPHDVVVGYTWTCAERGAYKAYDIVPSNPLRVLTAEQVLAEVSAELRDGYEMPDVADVVDTWGPGDIQQDGPTYVHTADPEDGGWIWYIIPVCVPRALLDAASKTNPQTD